MPHLARLADEWFALRTELDPLTAGLFGVPGADVALPDLSPEGRARGAERVRDLQRRVAALAPPESEEQVVTVGVLRHELAVRADALGSSAADVAVSGPPSPLGQLLTAVPKVDAASPGAEARYLERLAQVPRYLAQATELLGSQTGAGRPPTARALVQAIGQVEACLADPPAVFARSLPGAEAVEQRVRDEVAPALSSYLDALLEARATARPDDRCGLVHVDGGAELYAAAVQEHTTLDSSAEELHALGLELCEALRDQHEELGSRVLGTGRFDDVVRRLREDPVLRYASAEEVLRDAQGALARAVAALPEWFGRVAAAACEVVAMPGVEAPDGVLGYYQPPAPDAGRPGRHWVNTGAPHTRTRYEYEALAFHESIPGHHLQIALAQELELPAFRRYGYVAAFSEGWGLYAERLADEMGLYSSDLARFGMLSFDAWRAARLVVDTGLHALGWSRDRAIAFLTATTALTPSNVANEVDRYVAWPGQALAYMPGRLELDRLRRHAQSAQGAAFDVRAFHDAVLRHGSLPLPVLRDVVRQWAAA